MRVLLSSLYAGVERGRVSSHVASHEHVAYECLRAGRRRRRPEGPRLEGQLRVPARVNDERVSQPEEAL